MRRRLKSIGDFGAYVRTAAAQVGKYPPLLIHRVFRNRNNQRVQTQASSSSETSRSSSCGLSGGAGGGVRMTAQMASFLKLTLVGDGGVGKVNNLPFFFQPKIILLN